jgi:hypothetical protein
MREMMMGEADGAAMPPDSTLDATALLCPPSILKARRDLI